LEEFLTALGLLFAIEGLMFAAFPQATKRAMEQVVGSPDGLLRRVGIVSAILGVGLVFVARRLL
jgi:hypothetical protein